VYDVYNRVCWGPLQTRKDYESHPEALIYTSIWQPGTEARNLRHPEFRVHYYQTSKKNEKEVNNDRRVNNYVRRYYDRNVEVVYGGTRVERWREKVRDEMSG
jgi:hypothetical protein